MAVQSRSTPPVVLLVLDGWGWRPETDGNAIAMARTPAWDRLLATSPRTLLDASGLAVGLPEGQMGNSEVGHLNLGAGRVVPQDLVRINQSIQQREFFGSPALLEVANQAKRTGGTAHLVGLLGPGGVHAMDRHLVAAIEGLVTARRSPHRDPRLSRRPGHARPSRPPTSPAQLARDVVRVGGGRTQIAIADGPVFRDGPRQALGAHPAGVRRDGSRHGHADRRSGGGNPRRIRARRDRRIHQAADRHARRRAGGNDAERRRGLLLQLPVRPDAADRRRAGDCRI